MIGDRVPVLRRFVGLLGVLLALVYAGSAAAAAVDRLQHGSTAVHAEAHMPFSAPVTDADGGGHHPAEGDNPESSPGAPHHHADVPGGLVSAELPIGSSYLSPAEPRAREPRAPAPRARPSGLDRPPKTLIAAV
jgi:hypothetical protein